MSQSTPRGSENESSERDNRRALRSRTRTGSIMLEGDDRPNSSAVVRILSKQTVAGQGWHYRCESADGRKKLVSPRLAVVGLGQRWNWA